MNGNLLIRGFLLVASFFAPAAISVAIWEKCLHKNSSIDLYCLIEEYLIFFLLIHTIDIFVLAVRTGEVQRVMKDLVLDTDFSIGYLVQSLIVSVIAPCIAKAVEAALNQRKTGKRGLHIVHPERLIYIIAAVLFLMNFLNVFDNNFWGDETYTIWLAQMPVKDMLKATAGDGKR